MRKHKIKHLILQRKKQITCFLNLYASFNCYSCCFIKHTFFTLSLFRLHISYNFMFSAIFCAVQMKLLCVEDLNFQHHVMSALRISKVTYLVTCLYVSLSVIKLIPNTFSRSQFRNSSQHTPPDQTLTVCVYEHE